MNSIAPMSTPRVGWPTSSTSGSRSISRARTIFCWLPPEKLAVLRSQDGGRMSKRSMLGAREVADRASGRGCRPGPRKRSSSLVAEEGVLPLREGHDEAAAVAVLGHVGDPTPRGGRRRWWCATRSSGAPLRRTVPAGRGADAGEHLEQLGLAVAGDAGDAEDLAGAHVEARRASAARPPSRRRGRGPRTSSTTGPGVAGVFSTRSSTRRPTISSASSAGRGLGGDEASPPSRRGA